MVNGEDTVWLTMHQEGIHSKDDHGHDPRKGCLGPVPRRSKEHCYSRSGAEEIGLPLSHVGSKVQLKMATCANRLNLTLRNYAKSHPDLCILAVNTFVQDSEDPNPLIRALAIRTMGCIRVEKMVDYMEEPLRKTLRDESPYVRKTAAICVAKLFDLNPEMAIENGFLKTLQEMIGDPNPMVVANSVTALQEIHHTAPETQALQINSNTLRKMLMALNECTEWGRVTILSTLAEYKTSDVKESEHICERVAPQFQHVNAGVVLAAVKAVFLHMKNISPDLSKTYLKKMAPPLGMLFRCYHCTFFSLIVHSYTGFVGPRSAIRCTKKYRPSATEGA